MRLLLPQQGDPLAVLGTWMAPPYLPIPPDELSGPGAAGSSVPAATFLQAE